jgi:acyl dehydratase
MAARFGVGSKASEILSTGLTRAQIVQYAGASGDFNPVHVDEIFATERAGYPSVFAHGMLTMGLTAQALTTWLGTGSLTRFGVQFRCQVWPGDKLTATMTVVDVRPGSGDKLTIDVNVQTENGAGDVVLIGYATADVAASA